ncbi:MAG: fumarylacetoacetate hydrolase family protein [Coriobacteriia bacterium]|nr:fumarylacetoacetate hydrolase family protein [Coriobacteriia bacterium]
MKVVRVFTGEDVRYGLADDTMITLISDEPFAAWETEDAVALAGARLMPPAMPTKIVCVGINYRQHAVEMGHDIPDEPVIFLKPPTAMNAPMGEVHIPPGVKQLDYEGELAVVMGRRAHRVSPNEGLTHVLGYTCANDITARDLQRKDGQWTRAKGFDGFCPLGPWVETDVDPSDLAIETYLNGELKQSARTSDMIFSVPMIVSFVSHVMTLLPGDVILTGTPSGIGGMQSGDTVEVRIEGIGSLTSRIV